MGERKMNCGERDALTYFRSRGIADIVHEPDGNIPPDFLINGSIAVEVRRLNQFKEEHNIARPLEELEYKLMPKIRRIVNDFKGESNITSYIDIEYKRPLKIDKTLFNHVESVLKYQLAFLENERHYAIGNLFLKCRPATKRFHNPYRWRSSHDGDGGGMVVSNILESLQIIIPEKESKILPYKNKYPTWWLIVNDTIGYGLDEIDLDQLQDAFDIKTFFERIIFISATTPTDGVELIIPPYLRSK